jgi:hypothetical protein
MENEMKWGCWLNRGHGVPGDWCCEYDGNGARPMSGTRDEAERFALRMRLVSPTSLYEVRLYRDELPLADPGIDAYECLRLAEAELAKIPMGIFFKENVGDLGVDRQADCSLSESGIEKLARALAETDPELLAVVDNMCDANGNGREGLIAKAVALDEAGAMTRPPIARAPWPIG